MIFIVLPILIAVNQDLKSTKVNLMIVMAPVTFAWSLILVPLIYNEILISKKLKEVKNLANSEEYKNFPDHVKYVKGRNAKHPFLFKREEF